MENMVRRVKMEGAAMCHSFFDSKHVSWINELLVFCSSCDCISRRFSVSMLLFPICLLLCEPTFFFDSTLLDSIKMCKFLYFFSFLSLHKIKISLENV